LTPRWWPTNNISERDLRLLSDPAARVFRLLGIHPGPNISLAAAASLAGIPPARHAGSWAS